MLGIWMLLPRFGGLTYYFGVPLHHNFIFCLTGAIGLFYTFLSIRIPEGRLAECIRFLSKYSLGVYLIHEHLDLRTLWCPALTGWMKPFLENELAFFAAGLLFCVVVVFTAGVAVDFIREKIFGFFYRFLQNTPVARGIRKLDDSMTKKEG